MTDASRILLVEDNPADAALIQEMFAEGQSGPSEIIHVERLGDAITLLGGGHFALILLDLSLPDSHGLQTLVSLQRHAAGTPVVVLTGLDDHGTALAAVRGGAQDYLVKGSVDAADLDRAVQFARERTRATAALQASQRELQQSNAALANQMAILLELNRQPSFGALIQTLAHAGRRMGVPSHTAVLLRDPGTDAWYITGLYDVSGRPADMIAQGLPAGAFRFDPPPSAEPQPPGRLLAQICGADHAAMVAQHLGAVAAVCAAIPGRSGPRGALLSLPTSPEGLSLLAGMLTYVAPAAARHLEQEAPAEPDRVLDMHPFAQRAGDEIDRAAAFHRPVSIVAFVCNDLAERTRTAPTLARLLGRWDVLGRIDHYPPALAAVLPETDRDGVLVRLNQLALHLPPDVKIGGASYPSDGTTPEQLIEMARGRAARVSLSISRQAGDPSVRWVRGAPAGPGLETIRCPVCAVPYTLMSAAGVPLHAPDRERDAAREMLRSTCPRHQEQFSLLAPTAWSESHAG